jgi:hypothetical protein
MSRVRVSYMGMALSMGAANAKPQTDDNRNSGQCTGNRGAGMKRDCKKHSESFCMDADLATSAIVSYAMGYVVEKYPAAIEKVCTWIKRHWDAFDYWQQVNIIESCKHHNHHAHVTQFIHWMEQHMRRIEHNVPSITCGEATPKPNVERKLCR